jgi:GT2 family glycosyltransferase
MDQLRTGARPRLRTGVIIATIGRPELVAPMLAALEHQTRPPDRIVISATKPADVDLGATDGRAEVLYGEKGLTRQRNRGLDLIEADCDVVVFFDDDFVPARDWIEQLDTAWAEHPQKMCLGGIVLADGINGPGISLDEAQDIVKRDETTPRTSTVRQGFAPYGCNMAFRTCAIAGQRFDERLPLYGWQEDLDFGARIEPTGCLKVERMRGVHMGIKSGRVPGVRLGASQVINNAYLYRKGTMSFDRALKFGLRNVLANLAGSFRPQTVVDRRGRLKGNLIGLYQVLLGRPDPEYVERL